MLRLAVALALVLSMASFAPARADELESYRPGLLISCVDAAGRDRAALRSCVGTAANSCIEQEGAATMAYVLCFSAEADTWRTLMDAAAARLNAEQSYRDPNRLANATKAWESWMEAECEYWGWQEGGGSGEQVDRVSCAAGLTAERAISLIAALD
jgi:uncharacterized protein YecT (DUF1311 family)